MMKQFFLLFSFLGSAWFCMDAYSQESTYAEIKAALDKGAWTTVTAPLDFASSPEDFFKGLGKKVESMSTTEAIAFDTGSALTTLGVAGLIALLIRAQKRGLAIPLSVATLPFEALVTLSSIMKTLMISWNASDRMTFPECPQGKICTSEDLSDATLYPVKNGKLAESVSFTRPECPPGKVCMTTCQ